MSFSSLETRVSSKDDQYCSNFGINYKKSTTTPYMTTQCRTRGWDQNRNNTINRGPKAWNIREVLGWDFTLLKNMSQKPYIIKELQYCSIVSYYPLARCESRRTLRDSRHSLHELRSVRRIKNCKYSSIPVASEPLSMKTIWSSV